MIERVAIAGTDLALADVFASVTIRHGRASADDGPLASSATLSLVDVASSFSAGFAVADELEIDTTGAVPRFRGRITDAAIVEDTLSIIAIGPLGYLSGREVGAGAWPSETWSARVSRVFTEAGAIALLDLEVGDDDPPLAARAAGDPTTFGAMLGELAENVPAAIADGADGMIRVQALTARKPFVIVELVPATVEWAPEWAMVDDVVNVVSVDWASGTVVAEDAGSIARFEEREEKIETTLSVLGDAEERALDAITSRSLPAWFVDSAAILELSPSVDLGTPVLLTELPAGAPAPEYLGMVEGWEDHVEPIGGVLEWKQRLALSAPRLSQYGVKWEQIDPGVSWAEAGSATWANPDSLLTL